MYSDFHLLLEMTCARSWGLGTGHPWTFCVLPKGHEGTCQDWAGRTPDAPFFDDQPEEAAAIEKAIQEDRKREAKKGLQS